MSDDVMQEIVPIHEEALAIRDSEFRRRISDIELHLDSVAGYGSDAIGRLISDVEAIPLDDSWEEFVDEATRAKETTIYRLIMLQKSRAEMEKAAAAEAERARVHQEARELRIAVEAEERAKKKAEALALREIEEARRGREEAERAAKESDRRAKDAAERARKEAEEPQAISQATLLRIRLDLTREALIHADDAGRVAQALADGKIRGVKVCGCDALLDVGGLRRVHHRDE